MGIIEPAILVWNGNLGGQSLEVLYCKEVVPVYGAVGTCKVHAGMRRGNKLQITVRGITADQEELVYDDPRLHSLADAVKEELGHDKPLCQLCLTAA